jgi:hypothetical protein
MTIEPRCESGTCIAVSFEDDRVYISETERPDYIWTTRANWDTFVAGIQAPLRADIAQLDEANEGLGAALTEARAEIEDCSCECHDGPVS